MIRHLRTSIAAAVLAAAVGARAARADDPHDPVGETPDERLARRVAGLCPSSEEGEIRLWAGETAAEGRRRPGTALGASSLAAAAHELARVPGHEGEALALWRETRVAADPRSVAALEADWAIGSALLAAGDAAEAAVALESFERRALGPPATPLGSRERSFLEAAPRLATRTAPRLRARALVDVGRFGEAADVLETTADRLLAEGAPTAWDVLDDAARAAWRAGDRARALRDADRSVDASPAGRARVTAEQRRLLARHGLLDERADPAPARTAGPDFLREANEALRRVQGLDDAWTLALQVATVETVAGRPADAVPFFEWAFADPGFLEAARRGGVERGQLLVGAGEALRAGDPERALRWLRTAESVANGAIESAASLRLRIDAALASRGAPATGGLEAASAGGHGKAPVPGAAVGLGAARASPEESADPPRVAEPSPNPLPWAGLVAGAVGIALVTAWARRRARGGDRR